jgi:hypothetical protein
VSVLEKDRSSRDLSNLCQGTDTEDFVFAQRLKRAGWHGAYSNRIADSVKDFNRAGFFAIGCNVMVNKLNQIAAS